MMLKLEFFPRVLSKIAVLKFECCYFNSRLEFFFSFETTQEYTTKVNFQCEKLQKLVTWPLNEVRLVLTLL